MIDPPELNPVFLELQRDLVEWITTNPKTCAHITPRNARLLFTFEHPDHLIINFKYFNEDYFRKAFPHYLIERRFKAFLQKVCGIIRSTLIRVKEYEITLNFTLKLNFTKISKTVRVGARFS
ncbi:MAG: hypothetical protein ACHQF4_08965 [Sphingobacteriales bacterium]